MMLVVPSDPLNPRRVDEHFAGEAEAARVAGLEVGLVSLEALAAGDAAGAVGTIGASDDAVYRGWMMTASEYRVFEDALRARRCALRTTTAGFRTAHELPGWAHALAVYTPEARWVSTSDLDELVELCRSMAPGGGVLRDFVKSMKHYWHEAALIPDLADGNAVRTVGTRFLELRGDSFVGGFVVRRFERFSGSEVRTWWVDGRLALTTAHPDTADDLPVGFDLPPGARDAVAGLMLPFVTVDWVLDANGVWRAVELGDGQVSDRPTSTPAADLVAALVRERTCEPAHCSPPVSSR